MLSFLLVFPFYVFFKLKNHKKYKTYGKPQKHAYSLSKIQKTQKNFYNQKNWLWTTSSAERMSSINHLRQVSPEQRHFLHVATE